MLVRTKTTGRNEVYCHKLVKNTAESMAAKMYEVLCSKSNAFYAENPSEKDFISKVWPTLIEEARATLVKMLSLPYPEELKDQIAAAIIADNTLTRGRPQRVASRLRTGQKPH